MAVTFDETELLYVTGQPTRRDVLYRVDVEPCSGVPATAFLLRVGPHDDEEARIADAVDLHIDPLVPTEGEHGLHYDYEALLLDDARVSSGIWLPDPVTRVREPMNCLVDSVLIVGSPPLGASRRGDEDSRWVYLHQEHGQPTPIKRLVAMRNELTRKNIETSWGSIHYMLRERVGFALNLTAESPRAAVIRRDPSTTATGLDTTSCLARIDLYSLQKWLIHVSHHGGTEK